MTDQRKALEGIAAYLEKLETQFAALDTDLCLESGLAPPSVAAEKVREIAAALAPPPQPEDAVERGAMSLDKLVETVWQEIVEKDDRNSPEEYPEMVMLTYEELGDYMKRAALAAMPVDGWQDIATAPKDGTTVLLYRECQGWQVVGYGRWVDVHGIAGWISYGFGEVPGNLGLAGPTDWMPLPSPPDQRRP